MAFLHEIIVNKLVAYGKHKLRIYSRHCDSKNGVIRTVWSDNQIQMNLHFIYSVLLKSINLEENLNYLPNGTGSEYFESIAGVHSGQRKGTILNQDP